MRIQKSGDNIKLWLSENDTYKWANKAGAIWPCSELSGHRLFVEYDNGDLIDILIDGKYTDCSNHELTAIVSDFLKL